MKANRSYVVSYERICNYNNDAKFLLPFNMMGYVVCILISLPEKVEIMPRQMLYGEFLPAKDKKKTHNNITKDV